MSDFNKKANLREHLLSIKDDAAQEKNEQKNIIMKEIYELLEEAIFSVSQRHSFSSGVILIPSDWDFFLEGQKKNDKNPVFRMDDLIRFTESKLKESGLEVELRQYDWDDNTWEFEIMPSPRKMEFCIRIDKIRKNADNTGRWMDASYSDYIARGKTHHDSIIVQKLYNLSERGGSNMLICICDATEDWEWYDGGSEMHGGLARYNLACNFSMLRITT